MKSAGLVTIAVLTSFGGLVLAQQQDTSLGDVVRQHKSTKKAVRVITNEDIPSRADDTPAPVASAPGAPDNSAVSQPKADVSKDANTGTPSDKSTDDKTGKKDSAEVAAMKIRMDQLNKDIDNMQFSIKGMETQLSNENDDERRTILENAIKSRTFSLQHATLERQDLKDKLKDMEKPKSE